LITPPNTKPNVTKRKIPQPALVLVAVVAVVGLIWGSIALFKGATANYAEEVAKPLENALIANGAVKKCSLGNAGRGPDNDEPWYTAYFEVARNDSQTEALISTVATDNGYKLTKASAGTKGYLGAVVYIDDTSKLSAYPGYDNGKIALALALTNSGPLRSCPESGQIFNDANTTAISLEVRLPVARR
jgi:hypothetical protein